MKNKMKRADRIRDNQPMDRKEKKKVILRLIAFIIFFVLAVVFITAGVTRQGHKEAGLQAITAQPDEALPRYQLGVSFQHVFTGSSNEIKLAVSELGDIYASALKDVYRMTDPLETYDNGVNLATLNQSRGTAVSVPRELFEILLDADAKSRENLGYNLYAGALYREWDEIRYLLEPGELDPLNDPNQAERIQRLAQATADLDNFRLEVLDENDGTLRFSVRQSYLDLLDELELEDAPILDLNLLKDAYKLQLLAARLEEKGYHQGYLSTDSGLTLALSQYSGGDYCFYGLRQDGAAPAATLPVTPGSCAAMLRAFALDETEVGYYQLEHGGQTLLRHPWLPADGAYREVLLSAFVSSETLPPVDLCLAGLRLYAQNSAEEAQALAKALPDCKTALILREDPMTVLITDPSIVPETDYGYSAALESSLRQA